MHIYILHGQDQTGPFSPEEIELKVRSGELNATTVAGVEGGGDWKPLAEILPHLFSQDETGSAQPPIVARAPVAGGLSPATGEPWYEQIPIIAAGLFIAVFCCLPFGIVPLWLSKRVWKATKIVVTVGVVLFYALLLLLIAVSRGSKDEIEPRGRIQSGNANTAISQRQKFRLGDFTYEIADCRFYHSIGRRHAPQTYPSNEAIFLVVHWAIQNETNETRTVLADDFRLRDAGGRIFRPSAKGNTALLMASEDKDFVLSEVQPGVLKDMNTAFEIPIDDAFGSTLTLMVPQKGFTGSKVLEVRIHGEQGD